MFERFTEEARQTMHSSKYQTDLLGSPKVETEHILLALLEDIRLTNRFLEGLSVENMRGEIFALVTRKPLPLLPRDIPLSRDARQALLFAGEEADLLGDGHVSNHHILLGLLRLENCLAAQVLRQEGLSADKVRSRITASNEPKL